MDKFSYKVSMSVEACLLILLISTFYLTSLIGVDPTPLCQNMTNSTLSVTNATLDCLTEPAPTSLLTKLVYALWIFAIYFTFPGTYSTQPAVTTQTFGHKYGGTIYGFLFTSDIINNLLVGTLSRALLTYGGWVGFFLCLSVFGLIAFIITCFFPVNPAPGQRQPRPEIEASLIQCESAMQTKSTKQSQIPTAQCQTYFQVDSDVEQC